MRDGIAVRKWLDIAVEGIRFGPDREAVKAEIQPIGEHPYRLTLTDAWGAEVAFQSGTLPAKQGLYQW